MARQPPVPPPPGPPPRPPTPTVVKSGRVRAVFVGTPGRLRVAGVVAVVFCLVFAIGACVAVAERSTAITDARDHAAQLVRLQSIRSNITRADAAATNAFLVGGLEPADQRASYESGIAEATSAIAAASSGSRADAPVLAKINQDLAQYVGLIESARANNRQGFPIGAAYLRQAGKSLRADALPPLLRLVDAEESRITDDYRNVGSANATLVTTLALALIVLLVVQVWLSVKTRRTFNMNLGLATVIVVVGGLVSATAMTFAQHKAADVRSQSLSATILLSTARADAFDAKSAESLTLINRGSGQPFEAQYQTDVGQASAALVAIGVGSSTAPPTQLIGLLDTYGSAHKAMRLKDDGGNWDAAVRLATSNDPNGTKVAFAAFDAHSSVTLTGQAAQVSDDLNTASRPLDLIATLVLLAGFAAAVLAWRGIAARLREYR